MNWKCPYCSHFSVVRDDKYYEGTASLWIVNHQWLSTSKFVVCQNTTCAKFTLTVELSKHTAKTSTSIESEQLIKSWRLIPFSNAKVLPDYIPRAISEDYNEAHAIISLSPKASATLSRRCLQGMIRDFYKVSKNKLADEIDAIKDLITPNARAALDAIRTVGNIGAHMEKDINLIIDVDEDEALLLLDLIENLIEEWYVNKHDSEQRNKKTQDLIASKKALQSSSAGLKNA